MPLLAIGPSIFNLSDYTEHADYQKISLTQQQGDAVDQFKFQVHDPLGTDTFQPEDDVVWLYELDPNGWPTVNLLQTPSLNFTSGTVASGWTGASLTGGASAAHATSPSGSTPVPQAAPQQNVQQIVLANAANGVGAGIFQTLTIPTDALGNTLRDLPYYAQMYVWVAASPSNVAAAMTLEFHSGTPNSGPHLLDVPLSVNMGTTGQWQLLSVSGMAPAGTTYIALSFYATPSNATNSATLYLSSAQVERATHGNVWVNPTQTALQAGKYPTTPAVEFGAGTYRDWGNNNAYQYVYRQLRIFGGLLRIQSANYIDVGGQETLYDCSAVDYGILCKEAPANLIIPPQMDSSAIKQAGDYAANQGFLKGIDYQTFVASIQKIFGFVINWQTFSDVLTKIANMTVASVWVDPYKYLHYQPALAVQNNYPLADVPVIFEEGDAIAQYHFSEFKFDLDSTQSASQPVIEGSTQLSAPQTQNFGGQKLTLGATLASGTPSTTITLAAATTFDIPSGTIITLDDGASHLLAVTTSSDTPVGNTSIACVSFTPSVTYTSGSAGVWALAVFTVNSGNPIAQIDNLTEQGTQLTVGLADVNQFSQGFTAVYDPSGATITLQTAPTTAATTGLVAIFRYNYPVLVRLRNPAVEAIYNTWLRRLIYFHIKVDEIKEQQAAIDRANAELSQRQKSKPIGELVVLSPPYPSGSFIRPGTAIQITFGPARLHRNLFQVQRVELTSKGGSPDGVSAPVLQYKIGIGFYHPDFAIQMANANRDLAGVWEGLAPPSVLQDVLATADAWALTDGVSGTVANQGIWNDAGSFYNTPPVVYS